jgi:succinyl-diaminopimelate desuccinylase
MDLLERTAEMVAIPSVSLDEAAMADYVERNLPADALSITRTGGNVVARTDLGRPQRLVLAGHLDTVPANGNAQPRVEGDVLWGLGAADMKGGLAVMVELARRVQDPAVDVTWMFYVAEEIEAEHNGLRHLAASQPDLFQADLAIVGEPTGGAVEAGCQGSLRVEVRLRGRRAHTARPWMGRNAIHRAGRLLAILDAYEPRRPTVEGCEFREAVQAVAITGGVAGNVVPDEATVTVNVRYAPDRTAADVVAELRALLGDVLEPDDDLTLVADANGALPATNHPLVRRLRERHGFDVRAKLGWTDVARFAALGVPAVNLGPGDPTLAHMAEERVDRASLTTVYAALEDLLTSDASRS